MLYETLLNKIKKRRASTTKGAEGLTALEVDIYYNNHTFLFAVKLFNLFSINLEFFVLTEDDFKTYHLFVVHVKCTPSIVVYHMLNGFKRLGHVYHLYFYCECHNLN